MVRLRSATRIGWKERRKKLLMQVTNLRYAQHFAWMWDHYQHSGYEPMLCAGLQFTWVLLSPSESIILLSEWVRALYYWTNPHVTLPILPTILLIVDVTCDTREEIQECLQAIEQRLSIWMFTLRINSKKTARKALFTLIASVRALGQIIILSDRHRWKVTLQLLRLNTVWRDRGQPFYDTDRCTGILL